MIQLNTGAKMPQIGLGTWKADKGKVGEAVQYALEEAGYRHIDCAAIYENETEIGEALSGVFSHGSVKREDVFITSKLWNTEHDPTRVRYACEKTLKDLQLDYLDLYLMHWRIAQNDTGEIIDIPFEETWQAMEMLVETGLVRAIGVSNFTEDMLTSLLERVAIVPAMNQVEMHPYLPQESLRAFCHEKNIHITAYSPLGRPGQSNEDDPFPQLIAHPTVLTIADTHGKTPAQVLLRFGIDRGIVVIPKSTIPSRIAENINAISFTLSSGEIVQLLGLEIPYRYVEPSGWWGIPYFS
ncbi:MAG: hypothetical protein AUJ37_01670 [Candidatus Magasanikbacteria bacterium CG1_02_41_34]|nr:MAG: hypothetical protein AUJ37_01670 [Candidatus Magasanikbacteria bacterium CG1_02_41_34]